MKPGTRASGSMDFDTYREMRRSHWDNIARNNGKIKTKGGYYHARLKTVYRSIVQPGLRIIELGCGKGDLLAALNPSYGVGVDFSGEMLQHARQNHPELHFIQCDIHGIDINEKFDFIILSDIVNDVWDVQQIFEQIRKLVSANTRVIINSFSRMWELPLMATQRLGLSTPLLPQNWLTIDDTANMLNLTGFEVVRSWVEILWPINTPFLANILNKYICRFVPFHYLGMTNFIIARPRPSGYHEVSSPVVSVVVPARNEAGNIEELMERVPEMGGGTELIFVEGNSTDNTYESIQKAIAKHPEKNAKLFKQTGKGKGDAVRLGFSEASGDILMILDADMTVPPEDLTRFFEAIASGYGDFINGVRLVYPMEKQAMRFFNILGNKFFSVAFSWLFGQSIKDTLCGTKVISRENYENLAKNRSYFGDFDPFGDFDLLLGAAKLNLKIVEMPIRYRERKYGETNIDRWRHGWLLLKVVLFAMRKIKFV